MKYHDITKDDMRNGDGLRVVLWVSGCNHHCKGCQNPITWDENDGLEFGVKDKQEIYRELEKDYIAGLTFSGGDPLFPTNRETVFQLCREIKNEFVGKTIWIYTGYLWEQVLQERDTRLILNYTDVLVDGEFVEELKNNNYPWAGSTNQRVIDVQQSLRKGEVILHECD